jgi:hypothetical protein
MKRFTHILTAVALALVFATSQAFAQSLSAGVKGGVGFANLGGDVEGTESKTGFSGGVFFGVGLHEYFMIQFEGQYVQKGAQETEDGIDLKFKLDYIEFMVPATLTIPIENSPIMPRLYAGPALAIEASCGFSAEGPGGSPSIDVACDQVSEATDGGVDDIKTKSTDFGVFFGGGLDIAVGNGAITLDVLYNLGLSNINDASDEKAKNKNLQILAGYRFFFGG